VVNSAFDEPHAAVMARMALKGQGGGDGGARPATRVVPDDAVRCALEKCRTFLAELHAEEKGTPAAPGYEDRLLRIEALHRLGGIALGKGDRL